ncbi:RNA-directed DNA polymerase, eukaryota, partial [Tanacetum coccineum]
MCEESSEEILLKTAVEVEGWFENDEYYQKGKNNKKIVEQVGTLTTIKSLKKPCIAGFMKPINSTSPLTPPVHYHSPPPTSSSMIVTPSTPKPTTTKPLYHRMPPLLRKEERWGSIFNVYGARDFNHFITLAGLVEVQLEGYSYTWAHPSASKMSKLDRFLVSDGFLSLFPHTSAVCLDRHLSDHRPILLREFNTDYGATPFRLFHSWFDFQGFDDMITQTWNSINLNDSNAMVRFKKKLQALKKVIRLWIGNYKRNQMNRTTEIKIKLKDIDKLLDQLGANDDLLSVRSELLKQYHDIHSVETRESIQKAKIKWAVEGDENSKFFHGMINRKRANLAVKGVMIDGEWVDDPSKVKDEFRDYFASRFCDPGIRHGVINFNFPNRLNIDQSGELEAPISRDEIRRAVWDCGENKSPGPDGFTFEFFRKFWNIVGPDLCLAVEWFFHHASFPVGCNSSFIALIPKTLNPKSVGEYRPISLIGSIYKIVTKILANRLSTVIADIISNV